MAAYNYALGLTQAGMTHVEEITATAGWPDGRPPRGRFYESSEVADRSDGHVIGRGFPYAVWVFDWLNQAMVNQLRAYCPGYSADVYLRTRRNDGSFADYQAIMVWPTADQMDRRRFGGRYQGLEIQFRQLQAVSEGLVFYNPDNSGYLALLF